LRVAGHVVAGRVLVDHGKHSFQITDVISLSSAKVQGLLQAEGLFEFPINDGMPVPAPGLIGHDEARRKIYQTMQRIADPGSQVLVSRSKPGPGWTTC
jgi:hypothetical protein